MDPILLGKGITDDIAVTLLPKLGNRHGLVAGATGTGKTVTLMTLAEGFRDGRAGVPGRCEGRCLRPGRARQRR